MAAVLRMLTHLTDRVRFLVPRQRYTLWIVGISAICILALASTLLVMRGLSGALSSSPPVALATSTATDTVVPTNTQAATHTATTTRRPTPVSVVHAPPPPPVPTRAPSPPTATPCPTATATAKPAAPTATATAAAPTPTTAAAANGAQQPLAMTLSSACQSSCPTYTGNNPSQSQIRAALYTAADTYHLPRNLLLAVAWQESRWHEDVTSCDGGIGLMQLQYYTWPWLNGQSVPACGLAATNDDPKTLQGNANLGAKYLVWLSCFYSYWGANGGTSVSSPGQYTIAWYYQQAGLQYPDTKNADGSTNSKSFCAAVFNDPAHPEYAALPATTANPWSCPYSAVTNDPSLLDITLSAYNEGADYTNQNGIQNWWYVHGVEGFIPQFAAGALPA
ncbi:MAG: transglycosylase SLT domain-containing protein [Ktedonobacterales bacterium]